MMRPTKIVLIIARKNEVESIKTNHLILTTEFKNKNKNQLCFLLLSFGN